MRERGLKALLAMPNFYPVGQHAREVRICITVFDYSLARVNNCEQFWRLQKEICIRYFYAIHEHIPDQSLCGHNILGHRKHVRKSFSDCKNWIACLLICKCAYGWSLKPTEMDTLWAMGELPHNRLVHNMFVRPMLFYLCTEMNPHAALCYRRILKIDLKRLENNLKSKFREYGAYSMDEALRRMKLDPNVHPNEAITFRDEAMVSGFEYKFLRILTLIVPDFKHYFNQYTRAPVRLWLTEAEKRSLFVGYGDGHVIPRYGAPSFH